MRIAVLMLAACVVLSACATSTIDTASPQNEKAELNLETELQTLERSETDPYLWLEEVEGEAALAWVSAQNERTLSAIQDHPVYQDNYDKVLD
ncbi:MAG: hypothetical protein AAGH49_08630, partial [Pseudomonadota bacterium]